MLLQILAEGATDHEAEEALSRDEDAGRTGAEEKQIGPDLMAAY